MGQSLPTVLPPSPQIKNFQIFGDYPVNYNTGIPDISIPIYTIQSGDLEVPITLRYHSAGIKPREVDQSNIGAGWVLDVGGMVSRTIEGLADEAYKKNNSTTPYYLINQDDPAIQEYLQKVVSTKELDAQYDRFNYSFGDKNG